MNHESNRVERYIRTLNDIICRNITGIGEKWLLFVLPSCWAMNTQVSKVTGFSPYEMVYHSEPPDLFNFNYKPEQTGINVSTKTIPRTNVQKEGVDGSTDNRKKIL